MTTQERDYKCNYILTTLIDILGLKFYFNIDISNILKLEMVKSIELA